MDNTPTMDTKAISKKLIGDRKLGRRGSWDSDVVQRDSDYMWECIQYIPDPTLTKQECDELESRNLSVPLKWVTVGIFEPFVIEGVAKVMA